MANRLLKINLAGSLICLTAVLILDRVLIPGMNYQGAAIANLIAYTGTTIFFLLASKSYLKAGWSEFVILRRSDFRFFATRIKEPGSKSEE